MDNSAPVMETLSVRELISTREAVSPRLRVEAVVDQFFNGRKLEALALVENGQVLGLALRGKIFAKLFRRFGFELYARSPIIEIAETAPLIVRVTEPLDSILEKAMQRPAADIYDEVVVIDDERFLSRPAVSQGDGAGAGRRFVAEPDSSRTRPRPGDGDAKGFGDQIRIHLPRNP